MYRNNYLLSRVVKVSVYIIICFLGSDGLAKGISLETQQLANTKEVEVRVVCLGKRRVTSPYYNRILQNRPLTTDENYEIEMIDFKAKGKFTGFTFTGRAEKYFSEEEKKEGIKKLEYQYDVTLTIDKKTGALKHLEFNGVRYEPKGEKYSTWDVLIEGPIPVSEEFYKYNHLDYGRDINNDLYRLKKFHGTLATVVTKDFSGLTNSTYKWTFDHSGKKLSELNLDKPDRSLHTDTWFSVGVDVNAPPKVEIELVQPFTPPRKGTSIIPGNIIAKCENLGSNSNSYWVLF